MTKPTQGFQLPDIIKKICKTTSSEEISSLLNILPKELLEFILESSLIAQYNDIDKNIDIRVLILKFFDGNYAEIDGVVVSWFLYSDLDTIRCLRDGKFVDCNDFSEKLDEYVVKHYIHTNKILIKYLKKVEERNLGLLQKETPEHLLIKLQ